MKRIVIVAGDKSGDSYGGVLGNRLKENFPSLEIFSFGGDKLARHSCQVINLLDYSVCGIFEVVLSLKKILNIFKRTVEEIERIKPDLVILIDFPDFNLRLARTFNKKYPLLYYVSPQIWAWRPGRVELIRKYVDKMVVIFEFEKDFYKRNGIAAIYFGHPLLEIIPKTNAPTKKIISFLPGSRKNEVKNHLPLMEKAKTILKRELPDHSFRIIRPPNLEESFYRQFAPSTPIIPHSYAAIEESAFIIASSGTATVEIAVLEAPFLIIYKVNPLTWQLLKKLVKTEFIGMVNILSGKKVIEELLQTQATPQAIAAQALSCIKDPEKYRQIKADLAKVKQTLAPYGATEKLARYIGEFLNLTT